MPARVLCDICRLLIRAKCSLILLLTIVTDFSLCRLFTYGSHGDIWSRLAWSSLYNIQLLLLYSHRSFCSFLFFHLCLSLPSISVSPSDHPLFVSSSPLSNRITSYLEKNKYVARSLTITQLPYWIMQWFSQNRMALGGFLTSELLEFLLLYAAVV